MEAIILAGGFGTRLRHVVPNVPKPMAPIAGKPFLEIVLGFLARNGFDRVILSLGFMAEKVTLHFGSQFKNIALCYVIEDKPLGTGGALRLAMEQCHEDHVFVFNGDTYINLEVMQVEQQWQQQRRPIIVGCQVPDTMRYGRLCIVGDSVAGFSEKGVSGPGIINAGCYVLSRQQLDGYHLDTPFSFESDYLVKAVRSQSFGLLVSKGAFIDIGVPEDYERAQRELGVI